MMNDIKDQQAVSRCYQKIAATESSSPPKAIDDNIMKAAAEALHAKANHKNHYKNKVLIASSSIAASVFIAVVALQLSKPVDTVQSFEDISKKPMYLLQRSRVPDADAFANEIEGLVAQGDITKAQQLYKRYRVYYPNKNVSLELQKKLLNTQ